MVEMSSATRVHARCESKQRLRYYGCSPGRIGASRLGVRGWQAGPSHCAHHDCSHHVCWPSVRHGCFSLRCCQKLELVFNDEKFVRTCDIIADQTRGRSMTLSLGRFRMFSERFRPCSDVVLTFKVLFCVNIRSRALPNAHNLAEPNVQINKVFF